MASGYPGDPALCVEMHRGVVCYGALRVVLAEHPPEGLHDRLRPRVDKLRECLGGVEQIQTFSDELIF